MLELAVAGSISKDTVESTGISSSLIDLIVNGVGVILEAVPEATDALYMRSFSCHSSCDRFTCSITCVVESTRKVFSVVVEVPYNSTLMLPAVTFKILPVVGTSGSVL